MRFIFKYFFCNYDKYKRDFFFSGNMNQFIIIFKDVIISIKLNEAISINKENYGSSLYAHEKFPKDEKI